MKDINEKERARLSQLINQVEVQEDDLFSVKRQYEQKLNDFYMEMQGLNHEVSYLLDASPETGGSLQHLADDNWTLHRLFTEFMDEELDNLEAETKKLRRSLDVKREKLVVERNRLPWE